MRWIILCLAAAGCDRYLCDDAEAAARGGDIVREVYGWGRTVDIICKPLEAAQNTCRTDSPDLEGCTPFPGRAVIVEGRNVCRVVVHEGAHWLDMTCPHNLPEAPSPCWPTAAEALGKEMCTDEVLQ